MQKVFGASVLLTVVQIAAMGCSGHADPGGPRHRALAQEGDGSNCNPISVPTLTESQSSNGKVTASGIHDEGYEAWRAFDADEASMWISETWVTPAWIGYEWRDGPKYVDHYALTFINGSLTTRAPKDFALEAWDGRAWTAVDTRSEETNWSGSERREYAVSNPGSYAGYRLLIEDDNDPRSGIVVVSLGRLELFGLDCSGDGGRTTSAKLVAEPDPVKAVIYPAGSQSLQPGDEYTATFDLKNIGDAWTNVRIKAIQGGVLSCLDASCLQACSGGPTAVGVKCEVGQGSIQLPDGRSTQFTLRDYAPRRVGPFTNKVTFNFDSAAGTSDFIVNIAGDTVVPPPLPCSGCACRIAKGGTSSYAVLALLSIFAACFYRRGRRKE
jgi:MYXO-CTERM domain-containing protein